MCDDKVIFPTRRAALRELANTIRRAMYGETNRKECRVYPCEKHGGWHLTSLPASSGAIVG